MRLKILQFKTHISPMKCIFILKSYNTVCKEICIISYTILFYETKEEKKSKNTQFSIYILFLLTLVASVIPLVLMSIELVDEERNFK